jgi:hypothetical protein
MNFAITTLCLVCALLTGPIAARAGTDVSGEWYDWQTTLAPEKPWLHDYSQTLVMKIFLCESDKGKVKKVYLTFEDALSVIRKLDNLTLGIPKIVYLTGWQFTGHDSGYPDWSVVNERLKRPQDKTALDSLKWLMAQARQYHTTVSLHINMADAYMNSPLWKTYDENDIILKDVDRQPIKDYQFAGMQMYKVSYAQEWKLGFAQKRIDALLRMLPELKEAKTIHIDAFNSVQGARPKSRLSSPYLGNTVEDEIMAQRKILRYWRMNGVDVTAEFDTLDLKPDPFIGLQPMAWHFNRDNFLQFDWSHKPANFVGLPPSLYTGTPMSAEEAITHDPAHLHGLLKQFCTKVLPWYYSNNLEPKEEGLNWSPDWYGDSFIPALWLPSTIVAYSTDGNLDRPMSDRTWRLPQSWRQASSVKVMRISTDRPQLLATLPVKDGAIVLTLKAGQAVAIER